MFFERLDKKSDEELMLLVQQGKERAFTEIYHRYSTPIVRYFHRMLWKDENKAQDFLHDLFVKIIEKPQHFDPTRKFSTWIYSVAHNMCKNEYRKQTFRAEASAEMRLSLELEVLMADELDVQKFNILLGRALERWDEDDRSLFVMRHELEMTFAEIGEALKCPEGTAKSRWFYLRKNLAQQLQEFQTLIR